MTMNFNDAAPQKDGGSLIPEGTVVTAIMTLRSGGFGDDGYIARSKTSGGDMLDTEFTITPNPNGYERRKVWKYMSFSEKGAPVTRSQLRAALESAHGIKPTDTSPEAAAKRSVPSYAAFDGLPVCIKVGIEKGTEGYTDKNILRAFVTPDKAEYIKPEGSIPSATAGQTTSASAPASTGSKPAWAG